MNQKQKSKKNIFNLWMLLLAVILIGGAQQLIVKATSVTAQSYSGSDVVWAMNDIRAVYGLDPYVMRNDLMQLAQAHAEYMAEIQELTHLRSDGSQPNVTSENISLGPIQIAINTWMDDQPHKDTILAWSQGWAGAGVALSENGYVYISFDMIRMEGASYLQIFDPYPPVATIDPNAPTLAPGEPTPTSTGSGINQYVNAVQVSTPDAEGYLWHTVLNGQTVWAIAEAYDSTTAVIIGLNSLDADNPTIWVGQKLLVKMVETPLPVTATVVPTKVVMQNTATKAPTLTATKTPINQQTPTETELPSSVENKPAPAFSNASLGMVVILFSVVAVVGFALSKSGRKSD